MAKRMGVLKSDTCYHGNAGLASGFAGLAQKKLKPGGILALVLPLSAASGQAWQAFRKMFADQYGGLAVLSIAAAVDDELSFSADTGMAECLVIARKGLQAAVDTKTVETEEDSVRREPRALFASLKARPSGFAGSSVLAQAALNVGYTRTLEDGPYGGTGVVIGDGTVAQMLTAGTGPDGQSWRAVGLTDYALAQTAHALSQSRLWLPGAETAVEMKIAPLALVGRTGSYHLDIIGPTPRGPFDKEAPTPTATFPALWNHNAAQETQMVCLPDSELRVRPGLEGKAAAMGHG